MTNIYIYFNELQKRSVMFRVFAAFAGIYSVLLLPFLTYTFSRSDWFRYLVCFGVMALLCKYCITPLINIIVPRTRPYQSYHFNPRESILFNTKHQKHDSFPSDHTFIFSSFVPVAIANFSNAAIFCFLALALLVALGRVLLGYHYIRDVAAGFILGMVLGYALFLIPAPFILG